MHSRFLIKKSQGNNNRDFLTSERSEEVPFFIAAFGPGKGVTAIGGFLRKSCLNFWTRMMKLGQNVYFFKPERLASSLFGKWNFCERSEQKRLRKAPWRSKNPPWRRQQPPWQSQDPTCKHSQQKCLEASTRRHRVVGQVQVRTLFLFRVLGELKMNTSEQHEETW